MHKLLKGMGPDALLELIEPLKNPAVITTRSNTNNNLKLPAHNTNYIGKSFIYETAKLWNSIPLSIKQTQNTSTFKENLHKYYLRM